MPRLLCLGDSTTDRGRQFYADPSGNRGIDGFTLERLHQNMDSWLEASDPDIVTVLIGINDIGIMMNTRRSSAQQQDLMEIFAARYEQLARKLSGTGSRKRKLFFL